MGRIRSLAAWLPAVVLVPAAMAASIGVTRTDEDVVSQEIPMDPGTTWVYEVLDHGEPSGRRVRQVLGPSQLLTEDGLTEMTRISSVYDAHPDYGSLSTDAYVAVEGNQLTQHGLILNGENLAVTPPAPGYQVPAERGDSWEYEGLVGTNPYAYESEVTDIGDVDVGGQTFSGCAELTTTIALADAENGEVEVLTEWICPGIGVVRSTDVIERDDVDITEELLTFQGPDQSIVLGPVPEALDVVEAARPADEVPSTAGFDLRRSHAVPDGELGRTLAWTDSRDEFSGKAPVSDGRTVVLGERDGLVSARDVATGELRWQVSLTPPIVATPAVLGDLALVADSSKAVWALSLTDGSTQWVHRFDDVVSATPVATEDVIAVASEDRRLIGLSPDDGVEMWSLDLEGLVRMSPAVEDGLLVVGDNSGMLTAVDLDDGDVLWSAGLSNGLDLGPALSEDTVFAVDGDGVLGALDLRTGDLLWQARGKTFPTKPLAVTEDEVVAVSEGGRVQSFDAEDGDLLWSRPLGDLDVSPAIIGDEVMVVSEDGRVSVLDLDGGSVTDSWDLPGPTPDARLVVDTPLGLVGDDVVVTAQVSAPDFAYTSYAYPVVPEPDRPAGVAYTVRPFLFPVPLNAAPVLDGGSVYALGYDERLYRSDGLHEAEALVGSTGTTVGLSAADGVVVLPKGEEVWGVRGSDGKRLWKLPAVAAFLGTYPVATDGVAFVPIREVGLVAVDLHSGKGLWVVSVDGSAGASSPLPVGGGDVAYAGSGLTRYDGRTGDVVWALDGDLADSVAYAQIAADREAVYAPLTSSDAASPGFERTDVVAADLDTGSVRWRFQLASGSFGIGTAVDAGVVVAVDDSALVTALDARTGERLWSYQMASAAVGTPVATDGVVHLAERGRAEDFLQRNFRVVTLDLATGRFLGAYEPPSANDVILPTVGAGPGGELLVPTTAAIGQNVAVLEVTRD